MTTQEMIEMLRSYVKPGGKLKKADAKRMLEQMEADFATLVDIKRSVDQFKEAWRYPIVVAPQPTYIPTTYPSPMWDPSYPQIICSDNSGSGTIQ